ncbi:MAG: hypothetical protein SFV15_19710 [Polyangiaceae bacterium]|nr:hypothetical protein [Polyangiaceae bacterium]
MANSHLSLSSAASFLRWRDNASLMHRVADYEPRQLERSPWRKEPAIQNGEGKPSGVREFQAGASERAEPFQLRGPLARGQIQEGLSLSRENRQGLWAEPVGEPATDNGLAFQCIGRKRLA